MKPNKHPVKTMYIHNLTIQAVNSKIEKELENIIAKLHTEKQRKQGGQAEDAREIRVRIQERRVTARCHNGWRYVSTKRTQALNDPVKGRYDSDGSVIVIKDYLPDDLVALVFELEFKANIQNIDKDITICMGYNVVMPDFDQDMREVNEQTIQLKLRKGPNQTLENTLLLSDQSSENIDNIFDISLSAFISHDPKAPDDRALRRGKENQKQIGGGSSSRRGGNSDRDVPTRGPWDDHKKRDTSSSGAYKLAHENIGAPRANR